MRRVACCLVSAALLAGAAEAKAAQPVLRLGSEDGLAASWQRAMNSWLSAGGDPQVAVLRRHLRGGLRVDGVFGPRTLMVTEAFQREERVHVTGTVGLSDWMTWMSARLTMGGPAADTFRAGAFDPGIGWWQVALNRWLDRRDHAQLVVDCTLGPQTTSAVFLFQRALKLPATGRLDYRTWKAAERLNLTHFP
jgi:peptidoglycan hydrolase-like protein with peptidoglycan-binding domain